MTRCRVFSLGAIKALPIAKPMRWGSSDAEFIRPVHTLTVLYGGDIIDACVLGINASNKVSGHRFHGDKAVIVEHADNYEPLLKEQFVIADYSGRAKAIEYQLLEKAKELGLTADFDQTLLEEISSLVEWPVILHASFEKKFFGCTQRSAYLYDEGRSKIRSIAG